MSSHNDCVTVEKSAPWVGLPIAFGILKNKPPKQVLRKLTSVFSTDCFCYTHYCHLSSINYYHSLATVDAATHVQLVVWAVFLTFLPTLTQSYHNLLLFHSA